MTYPANIGTPIVILLVEDDPGDAALISEMLGDARSGTFRLIKCDRLSSALDLLSRQPVDFILLDLSLPDSFGLATLSRIVSEAPHVPVVVLTGLDDEEAGLQAMQQGAQDYMNKGMVESRLLIRTIRYAIERKRLENEELRLIQELKDALANVKTLRGLLPICASCKQIRDDKGYWQKIEAYLTDHSEAMLSHCICPDCMKKLYPEYAIDPTTPPKP